MNNIAVMRVLFSFRCLVVAAVGMLLGAGISPARADGFRRFEQTISPDGAWVLAWGNAGSSFEELKEWPVEEEKDLAFDFDNYLVKAATGKVVARVPDFHYFSNGPGHENHNDIHVAWAPDSQNAVAIYAGRWSDIAITWIEPKTLSFVSLREPMEAAYRRLLLTQKKVREAGEISFGDPVLLGGGVLLTEAWAQIPKDGPVWHYRLKLQIRIAGGKAQVAVLKSRAIGEDESEGTEDLEKDLNQVYGKLRATLKGPAKEALKVEEQRWLKQREAIVDDITRDYFTRMRWQVLRARLEDW